MSGSIENLLVRNLHEVFGERDPARPATAIEAIFDRDHLFSDPRSQHVGLEPWTMRLSPSRHSSRTTAFGPPHQPRQITGLNVAVVNAGRISAVYTFLDPTGA
jgi:hypothetical protein